MRRTLVCLASERLRGRGGSGEAEGEEEDREGTPQVGQEEGQTARESADADGVAAKRPAEMKMATCHEPMMVVPARDSLERLAERVGLLEQLATEQVLLPEVFEKTLGTMGTTSRR